MPDTSPILTPDQRLRVFVSSTLQELADERKAARRAIERLRLAPVLFELGARPHPPRELYRAYLEQSHIFLGIYWQSYGWVAPGEDVSGLEDEYNLSGDRPKLIYVKNPAPERQPRLKALVARIRDDDRVSYKGFTTARELGRLVEDDLVVLLAERFTASPTRASTGHSRAEPVDPIAPDASGRTIGIPTSPTTFLGREAEIAAVEGWLVGQDARLITLTGAGGIGKTRLALAVAERVSGAFRDGARFVPLAALSDASLVASAVAGALGVVETGGKELRDLVVEYLADKDLLLILDNFEQVADAAGLVTEILRGCPRVRILVTSRVALRLSGEQELEVPPLAAPAPGLAGGVDALSRYAAVRLFVARARGVKPDFALTDDNARAVAEICARLDGLPLAIELAAARVRFLPPRAMLSRLDSRLRLLTGGARDLPERQRTLRATIDWSYALLRPDEQTLFARLAIFVGGLTIDAVERVCDPDGDLDALEGLGSLTEKSLLLSQEAPDGEPRFEMLETIQEYAREKFEESGQTQVVEGAHAEYFLALAEAAEPELRGPRQAEWLGRLEEEHGNLRAALGWALGGGEQELGLRLAGALGRFWLTRSYLTEGRRWLDAALASSEGMPPAARAKVLVGAGSLARDQGDYALGMRLLEESVGLWRELGDRWWTAQALNVLALTADVKGESGRAVLLMEEALGLFRELGDEERSAAILINLGATALFRGDYDRSAGLLEKALKSRRLLSPSTLATALLELGIVALATGEPVVAESRIGEGLTAARAVGALSDVEDALEGLAAAAGATGRPERAARLWGAAQTLSAEIAYRPDPDLRAIFDPYIEAARARLGEAAWEGAAAEGRAMSSEEAIEYALEGLAQPAPDTFQREH